MLQIVSIFSNTSWKNGIMLFVCVRLPAIYHHLILNAVLKNLKDFDVSKRNSPATVISTLSCHLSKCMRYANSSTDSQENLSKRHTPEFHNVASVFSSTLFSVDVRRSVLRDGAAQRHMLHSRCCCKYSVYSVADKTATCSNHPAILYMIKSVYAILLSRCIHQANKNIVSCTVCTN